MTLSLNSYFAEVDISSRPLLVVKTINSIKIVHSFAFLMLTVNSIPVSVGRMEKCLWSLAPFGSVEKVIIMIRFSKNRGKCLVCNVNFCRLSLWFVRTVVKGEIYAI